MKQKRILMVTMSLDIGGAETHITELSQALSQKGYAVFCASNGGIFADDLSKNGIRHFKVPLHNKNPFNLLKSYYMLYKIIKKQRIDIVHAHARIPAFISGYVCRRLGVPMCVTVHGTYVVNRLLKRIANWGQKTLAVSPDIVRYLTENYKISPQNIITTENGINTEMFHAKEPDKALLESLHLDPGAIKLMHLGRLSTDSGQYAFTLCEIAPMLLKKIPDLQIIIVGDGPFFDTLKQKAETLNQLANKNYIILTGGRTDIADIINLCDGVIGLSRSALEALACKKPVILAGNYGYLGIFSPDKLEDCIKTNFTARGFCENYDGQFLDDCVNILTNPNIRDLTKPEICRQIVQSNYSIEKMTQDAISIYNMLSPYDKHKPYDFALLGYYGFNNSGDETLLSAIVQNLRAKKKDVSLCIVTKDVGNAFLDFGADAYHRFNIIDVFLAIKRSKILVFGGGNLIQDITSTKSLLYYISILTLSKILGTKTMLYANGIGPVNKIYNREITSKVLNGVNLITLREKDSYDFLLKQGVTRPKIYLTCDEALTITPDPSFFDESEVPKQKEYLCVSIRKWKFADRNFYQNLSCALSKIAKKYDLLIVFLPLHKSVDLAACEEMAQSIEGSLVLKKDYSAAQLISVLSHSKGIVGMRLHSLIYGLCAGVPLCGLVYDPKVSAFLRSANQTSFVDIATCSESDLYRMIDDTQKNFNAYSLPITKERLRLQKLANQNSLYAIELLKEIKNENTGN